MLNNRFFKSNLYFVILSIITTLFWFFRLESIGLPIFTGIAIIILIFDKNGINVIPFLLNMLFMISRTEWSMDTIPIYLYIIPTLILLAMIFHMIKNKIKLFDGKLKYPLLMLLAAMLLSTMNTEIFNIGYIFYYFIGIFYLFIYFFFKGSLKGDNLEYLIKLFTVLGFMIAIQIIIYYLRVDDIIHEITIGDIDLGWGISNFVAIYLVMFMTFIFHFLKEKKNIILYILFLSIEFVALLLTASRGGVISFGILIFCIFPYLLYGSNKKRYYLYYFPLILLFTSIIVIINFENFQLIYHRLFDNFFDDNLRFIVWRNGINSFLKHPIFGSGIFAEVNNNYFKLYHNTIIHTLATLGIFGMAALTWQFIVIIKIFIKNINDKKAIFFISLIVTNIHGMIDNVYYMPQFMIIFFIIVSAVENSNKYIIN